MLVNDLNIKFNKDGLIPAIIQEQETKEILMLAYMNEDSLKKSLESGLTHFWSRSQRKLWQKGENSGHIQRIQKISLDCDYDSLLIEVQQVGLACHTGHKSCFYQDIYSLNEKEAKDLASSQILDSLYATILERKKNPPQDSYTSYLFKEGLDKILKKVGEEASEVIIAAKNEDPAETIYETVDLIYHLLVTLVEKDIKLQDIYQELAKRRK